ncbi:MAG TPA: copper chaperone PCu(A)C [Anaerolineales bacterium]|nr:copper chaperone PCu(A)C [Anaerolineales bacterium]
MKHVELIPILGLILLMLAGCKTPPAPATLTAEDAWIRAIGSTESTEHTMEMPDPTPGTTIELNTAAFVKIVNSSAEADRLIRVESDLALTVEIHLSEMKDEVMTMRPVTGIDILAGETLNFEPGGYHIMLINLRHGIKAGEKYPLTLIFEKAGSLTIDAEVLAP